MAQVPSANGCAVLSALGRRAVACAGWRWMPGMLTESGDRIISVDTVVAPSPEWRGDWSTWAARSRAVGGPDTFGGPDDKEPGVPDFTDAATRGCLLELAREVWRNPGLSVRWESGIGWRVLGGSVDFNADRAAHKNEAEALVAMLEAAP